MSSLPDLDAVRRALPATQRTAYLNTGAASPWPTPVVEAIGQALAQEVALGRASPGGLPDYHDVLETTRLKLGSWVGAGTGELALTGSTTVGVNIAVWGLDWQPGDEVVTTSIEHNGIRLPLRHVAERYGVRVRVADVGTGTGALEAIRAELGPRTRLVAISHVSYSTGAALPVGEIAAAAHEVGAALLVDGAQSVGALPVDVHALDVDYYAFPGQKWLCGPEGTGGLYVRPSRLPRLRPTFVGGRGAQPDAVRYEHGTAFRPSIHGLHAALHWLDGIGREAILARTAELAGYCAARLRSLPNVAVITPAEAYAGLVCFRLLDGTTGREQLAARVAQLAEAGITIRAVADTDCLRVSCAFFNTTAEIDRLVKTISRWSSTEAH